MAIVKSISFILVHIIVSLFAILLIEKTTLPNGVSSSVLIMFIFIFLNVSYEFFFKLNALKKYWSLKKLLYLIPAVVAGIVINNIPMVSAYLFGEFEADKIIVNINLTLAGVLITLAVVAWEELWFRGLFLNYCAKYIQPMLLSVIMGFMFMMVHLLNPEIDLLKSGPALWAAGTLLTILYFYYGNIWVPLGLHFGNNYFSGMITTKLDNDPFWGGDGYYSAIILVVICILFAFKYNKKKHILRTY